MNLIDKLNKNTIIFPLASNNKSDTVQILLNQLLNQKILTATVKLFSFINDHEKIMNPAIGRGVAFHYSSSVEVKELTAILGISINGIDYESPDQQKVHFILLILDTHDDSNLHRKLINRFQHFINDYNYRTKVIDCKSINSLANLINDWENEYLLNEDI